MGCAPGGCSLVEVSSCTRRLVDVVLDYIVEVVLDYSALQMDFLNS